MNTFNKNHLGESRQGFDFLEFWAGRAVTSTLVGQSGRSICALDIDYFKADPSKPGRSNHYDILTSSGFLWPCCKKSKELVLSFNLGCYSRCLPCSQLQRSILNQTKTCCFPILTPAQVMPFCVAQCKAWSIYSLDGNSMFLMVYHKYGYIRSPCCSSFGLWPWLCEPSQFDGITVNCLNKGHIFFG